MRLWSLHPRLLDPQGLVALWREALLAQAVLAGRTRGYTNHPQLIRFRECYSGAPPILGLYLAAIHTEATRRGYRFDSNRIDGGLPRTLPPDCSVSVPVTVGQVQFELQHLRSKLAVRNPDLVCDVSRAEAVLEGFTTRMEDRGEGSSQPLLHPLFRLVPGPRAPWEKG